MVVGQRVLVLFALAFFAAAVFIVDLILPVGIEVWVLYLPVILALVWLDNVRDVMIASAICSSFVFLGLFVSPPGGNPPWWDMLNRGMGLAALWLMTFAGITIARRSRQVAETMGSLRVAIARHQQAERALILSEERLRLAAAGAGMGTWDVDLRTGKVTWSDTHFRMLGYEPNANGEATREMFLARVHPDDLSRVQAAQEQARRKRSLYGAEFRVRRDPRCDLVWLAVFGRYVYDDSGQVIRFAGVSFDITQRKELEREVLEIATREQQRIGQELHDSVGQELTGLGLMANAITGSLPESDPAQRIAKRLVAGLDRVHEQVRTLSRGLVPVQVEADGLRSALEDLSERTAEQSGIEIAFECDGAVRVPDHATATQLFRIAQEAVSNALRHGRPRRVELSLGTSDTGLCLQIHDDGAGISERSDAANGMGLRIMEYRAGLIGGMLRVESGQNLGTTVACLVPHRANEGQEGR